MRDVDHLVWDGGVGAGGNSAFQALNLAIIWGARRVILTGVDCGGAHWHEDHKPPLKTPNETTFARWIRAFTGASFELQGRVEVINASRETALECFPRMTIEDALNIIDARAAEHEKYARCYTEPNYRMGKPRMADAVRDLSDLPSRGSYLDVSTGRGEMLAHAERLGFDPVQGTEVTRELLDGDRIVFAEGHALPFADNSFDVVTLFDVIEHLIPGDDELTCREMQRVAKKHILIAANNRPSFNQAGDDLHINKRHYDEWDRLFREWFSGEVTWLKGHKYVSETWRIDL